VHFCISFYYSFILVITWHYHFIHALAAQKERIDWNSSMRSSRLRVAPVVIAVVLWSLPLFHSAESHHSLRDTIYVIIILYL
jgi:hypothetical protein